MAPLLSGRDISAVKHIAVIPGSVMLSGELPTLISIPVGGKYN